MGICYGALLGSSPLTTILLHAHFIGQEFTFAIDANGDLVRREKSWGCIALLGLAGTTVACELIDASGRQVLEATLSTGITTAKSPCIACPRQHHPFER